MNCRILIFLISFLVMSDLAWAGAVITYHGRILDPNDVPVENENVTFRIQILSPSPGNCLLYEEKRTLNMKNSNGIFVIPIGDGLGSRTTNDPGILLEKLFSNDPNSSITTATYPKLVCSSTASYTPQILDQRQLVVAFDDLSGNGEQTLPNMDINFVPLAVNSYDAQNIGGAPAASVLRVNGGAASALTPANFAELKNLITGSSTTYEKSGKLNGVTVPALTNGQVLGWSSGAWSAITPTVTEADPTVQGFAKSALPACGANQFLKDNGSGALTCVTATAGGGTLTSVSPGTGIKSDVSANGPITVSGTLSVDVGVGPSQIVQLGADGKLPAVDGSNLSNVTAIALSGTAGINTAGNLITSGNVQAGNSITAKNIYLYDSVLPTPNSIGLRAPADVTALGGTSYVMTLPDRKGTQGQVLAAKDNSGALEWITPSGGGGGGGTLTAVTADVPLVVDNTISTAPKVQLPKATSIVDGYLSAVDFSIFAGKQSAGNYVTTMVGDVTSSGFSAGSVTTTIANGAVGTLSKVVASPGSAGTNRLLATDTTTGTTIKDFYCTTIGHVLKWTGSTGFGCAAVTSSDISGFNADVDARIANQRGAANGVASLDANSRVPLAQLGSGVADGTKVLLGDGTWGSLPGGGITTFNGLSGATQTLSTSTVTGTAPTWSSSGTAHTLQIPMASAAGVTAGLLSKSDYDNFNSKVGSASSLVGDVSGTIGATSVNKIQGKAVTPGAYSAGQVLRYNGTEWVNAAISAATDLSGTLSVTNGGTGANSLGSGNLLVGGGTAAVTSLAAGTAGNVVYATGVATWSSGTPDNAGLVDKTSTQTISGVKAFTNYIQMAAQNLLRFADSDSSNYVALRAPATVTSDVTLTLPATAGTAGQVLRTDGSGTLSWTNAGGAPTNVIASGGAVDLSLGNLHYLENVGSTAIALSNMTNGGVYTIIVADTTSRQYTFSGCASSFFSPANAATVDATQTIYGITTVYVGSVWKCYITWSSDFQ